ncbi:MAG TPA: hypothetical protein VFI95_05670 [Terriglobales bacterium]|nr:hypothetical protein [Terriglobales bacterium]
MFVLAEAHEDAVPRQTVQPSKKRRIAAKRIDFAKYADEDVLSRVFGLDRIPQHAQADAVDEVAGVSIDKLECLGVAAIK